MRTERTWLAGSSSDGQGWTNSVTIGSIASTKDPSSGAYPLADYFDGQARAASLRIG